MTTYADRKRDGEPCWLSHPFFCVECSLLVSAGFIFLFHVYELLLCIVEFVLQESEFL